MKRCINSSETTTVAFKILKKILATTNVAVDESVFYSILQNPFYSNPVIQVIRNLYNLISASLAGIPVKITSSRICDQCIKLVCDANFMSERIIQQDCLSCVPFDDDYSTNTALRACFKARMECRSQYRLQILWILLLEAIARFCNLNEGTYRYDIVQLTDFLLYANDVEFSQHLKSLVQISMSTNWNALKLEAGNE